MGCSPDWPGHFRDFEGHPERGGVTHTPAAWPKRRPTGLVGHRVLKPRGRLSTSRDPLPRPAASLECRTRRRQRERTGALARPQASRTGDLQLERRCRCIQSFRAPHRPITRPAPGSMLKRLAGVDRGRPPSVRRFVEARPSRSRRARRRWVSTTHVGCRARSSYGRRS